MAQALLGGVINVITRKARASDIEADLVAQWSFNPHERTDSNEYNLYAGLGRASDEWDYYVGAAHDDCIDPAGMGPKGSLIPD